MCYSNPLKWSGGPITPWWNTPYSAGSTTKQGSVVQRLAVSLGILGWIVKVKLSLGDMIAFTETSSGQSRIKQAILGSSSSNSLKSFGIMTSVEARKVVLIWGINIPEVSHFIFLPLEAWKSSSKVGLYPKPNLPLLSKSSMRAGLPHPTAPRPRPNL